jgi:hypothetical protein
MLNLRSQKLTPTVQRKCPSALKGFHKEPTKVRLNEISMTNVNRVSIKRSKCRSYCSKTALLWDNGNSTGAQLRLQVRLVVGALMTLSVNDRVHLERSAARSRREDGMEAPKLVGHGSMTYDSTWVRVGPVGFWL